MTKEFGYGSDKSLSIIYVDRTSSMFSTTTSNVGKETSLDLMLPNEEMFQFLFNALTSVLQIQRVEKRNTSTDDLYAKKCWEKADKDHSGSLTMEEVTDVVGYMNMNIPKPTVAKLFKKVDVNGSGHLQFNEFITFIDILRMRPDMEYVWTCIVKNEPLRSQQIDMLPLTFESSPLVKASITIDQFITFWNTTQAERLSKDDAVQIIKNVTKGDFTAKDTISYSMFLSIINSSENDMFRSDKAELYQDMGQSMSSYFIASSHNTYLEGDQLQSNSSVNRYISDLLKGCRCVEIDAWDGDSGEPIVYHGHTLTSKIKFIDVVKAIKDHGFTVSPYPIVISLENHCSLPQQEKIASNLKNILGSKLAVPTPEIGQKLPSPEELKGKVLLKAKRSVAEILESQQVDEDDEETSTKSKSTKSESEKASVKKVNDHAKELHPALQAITFLSGGKVKKFNQESFDLSADKICSFSEHAVLKYLKNPETIDNMIIYNKKHLSRTYPKGTRVDSSNYLPTIGWAGGNQLVALNYQTPDQGMHLNYGKFRENGYSGYVLKPQWMMNPVAVRTPAVKLTVLIMSASQLPKPGGVLRGEVIDPFVVVSVHAGNTVQEKKTRTINDNGFNPTWNEVFTFEVSNPDISMLLFAVFDEDVGSQEFIAFGSLPVTCIRPGIRLVNLLDGYGNKEQDFIFCSLTVRIAVSPL